MLVESCWLTAALAVAAHAVSFTVLSKGGKPASPYAYGLMFEDINNSGDGGVYAELIQNRAFQGNSIYPTTLDWWSSLGGAQLALKNLSTPLSAALPTSMQVTRGNSSSHGESFGFSNGGFWGFPVVSSWTYKGSFWVRGDLNGVVTVDLVSLTDRSWAQAEVQVASTTKEWTQYNYTLQPGQSAPNSNNTLRFTFPASAAGGPVHFNLLSLFPPTYKDRPNGNRIDLMDAMAGLYPSFFRLPGGNNLEGSSSPYWWNWTNTIGPLEQRPGFPGTWDYTNTNGLGILEYLQWSKDLGMEPILAVWSGLWLDGEIVPVDGLRPYIQSALDEIEFLSGDASTPWGARREALGYGPFPINYVEVGNEDNLNGGTRTYAAYRFNAFYKAIKQKYPCINIIASHNDVTPHYDAGGDYHEYAIPRQMSNQFRLFDNYTSEHPILLGEYAVTEYDTPGKDAPEWHTRALYPFWYGSVAEAIFLLGAERNADKIIGASYAPTFMNYNRKQWIPDLIQYDANPANTVLGTSYYMIQLLSQTRITETLPLTFTEGGFGPAYFVAGRSAVTGSHIVKAAVYNSSEDVPFSFSFDEVPAGATGKLTYLTAPMNASNTIGNNVVQTHTKTVRANTRGVFSFNLPDYSVAVFEIAAGPGNYAGGQKGWKGWDQWKHGPKHPRSYNEWGQVL